MTKNIPVTGLASKLIVLIYTFYLRRVPVVFEEYNKCPHRTTGFAPCWLMYGMAPVYYVGVGNMKPVGYTTPQNDIEIAFRRIKERAEKLAVHNSNTDFHVGECVVVELCSRSKDAIEWYSIAKVIRREANDQYIKVQYLNNNVHRPKGMVEDVDIKLLYHLKNDIDIAASVAQGSIKEIDHGNIGRKDVIVYIDEILLQKKEKDVISYLIRYSGERLDHVIWLEDNQISPSQLTALEHLVCFDSYYELMNRLRDLFLLLNQSTRMIIR